MKHQTFDKSIIIICIFVFALYVLASIFGDLSSKNQNSKPSIAQPTSAISQDTSKPVEVVPAQGTTNTTNPAPTVAPTQTKQVTTQKRTIKTEEDDD